MAFDGVYNGRQVLDSNGDPVANARIYFYRHGTVIAQNVWANAALSTLATNPVIADAAGYYDAFLSPSLDYDVVIKSADDAITYSTEAHSSSTHGGGSSGGGGGSSDSSYTIVDTVAEVQALTGTDGEDMVQLVAAGREGLFVWSTADESANVTPDTKQAIYIAPDSDDTGASGAWVRQNLRNEIVDTWAGSDADSLAKAALLAGGKKLLITAAWTLAAAGAVTLPANTEVVGQGGSITLSETDTRALTAASGCKIKGLAFTGQGTSTSSSTDTAIFGSGLTDIDIEDCKFTNFAGSPTYIANSSEIDIDNCRFEDNIGANDPAIIDNEIYLADSVTSARIKRCTFKAHSTNKKSLGLFVTTFDATGEVQKIQISNCESDGYRRGGVSISDESTTASYGSGLVIVSDCQWNNSGQTAMKLKNISRYTLNNVIADGYELTDIENESSGLKGAFFLNAGGSGTATNLKAYTTSSVSSVGVTITGNPNQSSYADPTHRTDFILDNITVEGTTDYAVEVQQRVYNVELSGVKARNCQGWIRLNGGNAVPDDDNIRNVSIIGGSYRLDGAGGSQAGLLAVYTRNLTVSSVIMNETGGHGIRCENCENVKFSSVSAYDVSVTGVNTQGWSMISTTGIKMVNCEAKSEAGTGNMVLGIGNNGSDEWTVIGGEYGGSTAGTGGAAPDNVYIDPNVIISPDVTWVRKAVTESGGTIPVNSYFARYYVSGSGNVDNISGGRENQLIHLTFANSFTIRSSVGNIVLEQNASKSVSNTGSAWRSISLRREGSNWIEM